MKERDREEEETKAFNVSTRGYFVILDTSQSFQVNRGGKVTKKKLTENGINGKENVFNTELNNLRLKNQV